MAGSDYSCGSFSCIDPHSGCLHPLATEFPDCSENLNYMGDLYCDFEINIEVNKSILTVKCPL